MADDIRIIQMAAFGSNIGDNANATGVRATLARNLGGKVDFTDWEMVDYSWGLATYCQDDIDRVNQHNLLIIGGGGFFELIPDTDVWTGTRVAIPEELFWKIKVPIVFYGLGCDVVRGGQEREAAMFRSFLDRLESSGHPYLLSTRHDGTMDVMRTVIGPEYAARFTRIPDGGFFTEVDDWVHPEIPDGGKVIVINFGGDLLWKRFPNVDADLSADRASGAPVTPRDYESYQSAGNAAFELFLNRFCKVMIEVLDRDPDMRLVFVPHIYRDIPVGYHLIDKLGFPYSRRRIHMAPYMTGWRAQSYLFDLYRKAELTIGQRFHANVCPIGLGTPSIGLATFPMTRNLYAELGMPERSLDPNAPDFEDRFRALVDDSLANPAPIRERYRQVKAGLEEENRQFHRRIAALMGK